MTLAIGAASPASYAPTTAPVPAAQATAAPAAAAPAAQAGQPAAAAAPASAAASGGQQQRAALNQLLSKYKYGQSHNIAASTLSALGKQIMADAKTLGQHVTLPRAPAGAGAAPAAPVANAAPANGKVNVTA